MSTTFGPQLIGETEKTLNAILRRVLEPTGLTEAEWVTLRLAGQLDGGVDATTLRDRAHFADASALIDRLEARGLLAGGRLTAGGRELVGSVQAEITATAGPIWQGLPPDDVAVTERVLNELVARARAVLAA